MDGKWFQEVAARCDPVLYSKLCEKTHFKTSIGTEELLDEVHICVWFSFNLIKRVAILSNHKIPLDISVDGLIYENGKKEDVMSVLLPCHVLPVFYYKLQWTCQMPKNSEVEEFIAYMSFRRPTSASTWPVFDPLPMIKCSLCDNNAPARHCIARRSNGQHVCIWCWNPFGTEVIFDYYCPCGKIGYSIWEPFLHTCPFVLAECNRCQSRNLSSCMRLSYHPVTQLQDSLRFMPNELLHIISLYAFARFFICCNKT